VDARTDGGELQVPPSGKAKLTFQTIQKWGNRRANLYWEKHLKAGHVPPEQSAVICSFLLQADECSKIESFIRSKYESRRWAMEGPPPSDPSTLENGGSSHGVSYDLIHIKVSLLTRRRLWKRYSGRRQARHPLQRQPDERHIRFCLVLQPSLRHLPRPLLPLWT
jgi:hypothetical protein